MTADGRKVLATRLWSSMEASATFWAYLEMSGSKFLRCPSMICANMVLITALLGICTAKVAKCLCMRGVMLKEPAVGFMHAMYWQLSTSLSTIFCLSYQPL